MKVHVFELIHERALARLKERADVVDWNDPAARDLSSADAVIVRAARVTRAMMEAAPRLRVVGKHGVGTDNIDLAAARELGKTVVYTPHANMESVAELAVAFMLTMARRIPYGYGQLRAGVFTSICPPALTGTELNGKTLGLVGLGRIGQRICAILRSGFGMRAAAFDPALPEGVFAELGVERADTLEEMLPQADYINISVPLIPQTANLLDARRLALCRPTAILVNTSRGGIVDEAALHDALSSGKLRAAASDVFAVEPVRPDHPLFALPNFVGMPHIGATTEESLIRMGETVVDDVLGVLEGKAPRFPVPGK